MDTRMAAYHEAAHAVADYLLGVHIDYLCVAEISKDDWVGVCLPVLGGPGSSLNVRCVILLAGMFGAQLSEETFQLRIPSNTLEFAKYGALGWDYEKSWSRCASIIIQRTDGWLPNDTLNKAPELKSQFDEQREKCKAATDTLYQDFMHLTLKLISENRLAVAALAKLLLDEKLELVKGSEHRLEDYEHRTLPVRRLSGDAVESFLRTRGLIFDSQRQFVENVPYPKGYAHVYHRGG